jgi:imidazolonepropionase
MLIRHRVLIALATDCNPGTSYVETMPFVIAMAVLLWGMPLEQAVWAATRGGALALDLPDRGLVQQGATAQLVVLDADHPVHLAYRPDTPLVWRTLRTTTAIG